MNVKKRPIHEFNVQRRCCAFTLVELLVVIEIIAILATLLIPPFSSAERSAKGLACVNNLKQLATGWILYSNENHEKLMQNSSGRSWVIKTYLTWGPESINTNTEVLIDSKKSAMADYISTYRVYKCPGDTYQSPANPGPRVRSYSMNGALNNHPVFTNETGRIYFTARKTPDLANPGPANIFV